MVLCLGSGGWRGLAHAGVLHALTRVEVPLAGVAACGLGAALAVATARGADPLLAARLFAHLPWADWSGRPEARREVWATLFGAADLSSLPFPVAVAACDLVSGRPVTLSSGPVVAALEVALCLPGRDQPVELQGQRLVSGAWLEPVPVTIARALQRARGAALWVVDVRGADSAPAGTRSADLLRALEFCGPVPPPAADEVWLRLPLDEVDPLDPGSALAALRVAEEAAREALWRHAGVRGSGR